MVERPIDKQTKAQILDAYDDLLSERNALEKQIQGLQQQKKDSPAATSESKRPETQSIQAQSTPTSDKMTATLDVLMQLQLGFGSSINELSEKLTAKATQLQQLQRSIAQELEQLQSLHQLENIQPETLETLICDYEEETQVFETTLHDRRATLEQDLQDLQQAWTKEQEDHERTTQERQTESEQSLKREAQEYEYTLNLARSLEQAEFQQRQKTLQAQLAEAKQEQERLWAEREKAIAQQEEDFAQLKSQVDAFEQEKAAAIQKAIDTGKATASYQAKVSADLRNKELEGAQHLYELQIQSLEDQIQTNTDQIQTLSKQLDAVLKQVQDLALKAIDGSANIQSYQAFKEIALEQAKNQAKVK
jgi:hypothetical protein